MKTQIEMPQFSTNWFSVRTICESHWTSVTKSISKNLHCFAWRLTQIHLLSKFCQQGSPCEVWWHWTHSYSWKQTSPHGMACPGLDGESALKRSEQNPDELMCQSSDITTCKDKHIKTYPRPALLQLGQGRAQEGIRSCKRMSTLPLRKVTTKTAGRLEDVFWKYRMAASYLYELLGPVNW